ncbi:MAG: hypothetical protein ACK583_16675 [Cyanobacteriota bacterium]|jgi:hypothetical protein
MAVNGRLQLGQRNSRQFIALALQMKALTVGSISLDLTKIDRLMATLRLSIETHQMHR